MRPPWDSFPNQGQGPRPRVPWLRRVRGVRVGRPDRRRSSTGTLRPVSKAKVEHETMATSDNLAFGLGGEHEGVAFAPPGTSNPSMRDRGHPPKAVAQSVTHGRESRIGLVGLRPGMSSSYDVGRGEEERIAEPQGLQDSEPGNRLGMGGRYGFRALATARTGLSAADHHPDQGSRRSCG